ncbi:hypothetical protein [Microcoleus vaginatus]|uniref:hypothetical protein n=1 Tax=Microcoleus vaginatus TaxID=119532 RepID=UPI001F6029A4
MGQSSDSGKRSSKIESYGRRKKEEGRRKKEEGFTYLREKEETIERMGKVQLRTS